MSIRTKTDIMWALQKIDMNGKYLLALSREGLVRASTGTEIRLVDFYGIFKMDEPIHAIAAVGTANDEYPATEIAGALRRPVRVEFEVEEHAGEDLIAEIKIRLYKTDEEPQPIT